MNNDIDIAVLIPCYNEAAAIPEVIDSFRRYLPAARIYVYDNNSTDDTAKVPEGHGAIVRSEPQQGKGHVVRRMFSDIDASLYILVDGDDTHSAESACGGLLIVPVSSSLRGISLTQVTPTCSTWGRGGLPPSRQ